MRKLNEPRVTLADCVNTLLADVNTGKPGKDLRRFRSAARAAARVINDRWDGWNSVAIDMDHSEMVCHLYPRKLR